MTTWINNDGLVVKFHNSGAIQGKGGALPAAGASQVVEFTITATELTSTAGTVLDHNLLLPKDAYIEKIEVISEVAATSGGSATLDIGLARLDRTTELDNNGLVAALALSTINATGEHNTLLPGGSGAGALVGTKLANAGVITVNYGTAAFTAGVLVVRVYLRY